MVFPDKFTFRYCNDTYKAASDGDRVRVYPPGNGPELYYPLSMAERFVESGKWVDVKQVIVPSLLEASGIKLGDDVVVIDAGGVYSEYGKWAASRGLTSKWDRWRRLAGGTKGKAVYIGTWDNGPASEATLLVAIEVSGNVYIYGRNALRPSLTKSCNGIDAEGNPKNFTIDDLETLQRVETRYRTYIVVPNSHSGENTDGPFVLTGRSGWSTFYNELPAPVGNKTPTITGDADIDEQFLSVAVYERPDGNHLTLDLKAKGPLVWMSKLHPEYARTKKEVTLRAELKAVDMSMATLVTRKSEIEASLA